MKNEDKLALIAALSDYQEFPRHVHDMQETTFIYAWEKAIAHERQKTQKLVDALNDYASGITDNLKQVWSALKSYNTNTKNGGGE